MNDRTILIIDDTSSVREQVAGILRKPGFKIITSVSPRNATAILQSIPTPDLIIVDLIMPDMDGIQFILSLRSRDQYKNLPIILMTAEQNPDFLAEAEALNLAGLLLKPMDEKKLLKMIERVL